MNAPALPWREVYTLPNPGAKADTRPETIQYDVAGCAYHLIGGEVQRALTPMQAAMAIVVFGAPAPRVV